MLVRNRMSRYPVTTNPAASVPDALQVMQGARVRRLPVVNDKGNLVGIVSQEDLFRALPSNATSLSKYEIPYLLDRITIETVMTRDVITVTEDTPLEEASRIMADNGIGALPVMRDGRLVGMISGRIIGNLLADIFGARRHGVRLTVVIPQIEGTLADITGAVAGLGGHFVALGEVEEPETNQVFVTMKVQGASRDAIVAAIKPLVLEILDVRES